MTEHYEGVVIYTDGSARPTSRGKTGWGAHGYRYTTEESKRGTGLAKYHVTNCGYIKESDHHLLTANLFKVTPLEYFDFFGGCIEEGTNNSAEVDALYHALEKCKDLSIKKLQIYTDSEYLRRGLKEGVPMWERRRWRRNDGSEVPNSMNWIRLKALTDALTLKGVEIKIDWVKGHADNFGNVEADKLATIGVIYALNGRSHCRMTTTPSQGYWKRQVEKHPFISFKHLYFNSLAESNILGHYYLCDPAGDIFSVGQRAPDSVYSVIRLKEYDTAIEIVRKQQYRISMDINSVVVMRLDKLFAPDVHGVIVDHKECAMTQTSSSVFGLDFVDDKNLTVEIKPSGKALRAIESFSLLDDMLDRFIALRDHGVLESNHNFTQIHDITDTFYAVTEKTVKNTVVKQYSLQPQFASGPETLRLVNLTVPIDMGENTTRDVGVSLLLGSDTLPRNQLKRLEAEQPRIYLITWRESQKSIRYATIAEIDSGCGIWSNFFADRVFLS